LGITHFLVGGPRPRIELKSAAKAQLRMSCATYAEQSRAIASASQNTIVFG
jgi:hypothetical protein